MEHVIVIGAGLGGLAAACRIAKDGRRVTVIERNETPGGKVNLVDSGGFRFDTGASLLTMPKVFEDLFNYCGRDMSAYLELVPLDPVCRYKWQDGAGLDTSTNIEETADAIREISAEDADSFGRYLRKSREKYEIAERTFLSRSLNELPELLSLSNLPDLFRISTFSTLSRYNKRHFRSPRIRQLFDRYATYNGSSPFKTPATFSLIPWVELGLGAWYPKGGIHQIPSALRLLAEEMGAVFRFGEDVEEIIIRNGRAAGVRLEGGTLKADAVVCNADAVSAYGELILSGHKEIYTDRKLAAIEPSCSGFVVLLGTSKKFDQLAHHNIFFSEDYRAEFDAIFRNGRMPEDPTIYVCATSRTDLSQAPDGCENLFVLVNAPYTGGVNWEEEKEREAGRITEMLEARGLDGLSGSIVFRDIITPADFERRYRANRGSIYGVSSNGILSAFLRVPNKAKDIEGLFFVGGTTHPGGGMPLVLLSAKMAAALVESESS